MAEHNEKSGLPAVRVSSVSADSASQLSPQLFEQFLANQAKEIELRSADLSLQKQKDDNAFTYAREALKAQVDDRKDFRAHECKKRDRTYIFSAVVIVVVIALVAYCLHTNHEALASELIKVIIYVGIGGLGGYSYGRAEQVRTPDSNESVDVVD